MKEKKKNFQTVITKLFIQMESNFRSCHANELNIRSIIIIILHMSSSIRWLVALQLQRETF